MQFPLGVFTAVTGVSGSGKSTLVNDILYRARRARSTARPRSPARHEKIEGLEHLDKVIDIDQSPIGRTPRSNPATYTNVFNPIRELMAQVPEARMRGYGPGRFSFNVKGGRCENCGGGGQITIEMHFLPDIYVTCDVCGGKRYNRETLEVRYKGSIHRGHPRAHGRAGARGLRERPADRRRSADTLNDVGLGYIQLGQSATTLSGGEAQRVKLARELARRSTGRTLYILDEPTTGLHFDDIKKLLSVLRALVERGNTVVVIEHNLDVVRTADWVIDLGPEGGDGGGREIVAEGTPEEVARVRALAHGRVPAARSRRGAGARSRMRLGPALAVLLLSRAVSAPAQEAPAARRRRRPGPRSMRRRSRNARGRRSTSPASGSSTRRRATESRRPWRRAPCCPCGRTGITSGSSRSSARR